MAGMVTSFMTLILFTLPPDSGELMVMGVTTLLSLTVFYSLASTHIPEMSEVVPLIGRYGMMGGSVEIKKLINLLIFVIFELAKFATVNQYGRIGDKTGRASLLIFPTSLPSQPVKDCPNN